MSKRASKQLFPIEKDGKTSLTDSEVWPYYKERGWKRPGLTEAEADASAATARAEDGAEMRLMPIGPCSAGQTKTLTVQQQGGPAEAGAAAVQFSNDPAGPWATDESTVQPYSAQDTEFEIEAEFSEQAYARVGAWPDQSLSGEPLAVSNSDQPNPWNEGTSPAPESRG